jgi:hypothetical protein
VYVLSAGTVCMITRRMISELPAGEFPGMRWELAIRVEQRDNKKCRGWTAFWAVTGHVQ